MNKPRKSKQEIYARFRVPKNIQKICDYFFTSEKINYLVFGAFTTLVNIAAYWAATKPLGIDYRVATAISWVVAVAFAFVTNKIFVFKSKSANAKALLKEAVSFVIARMMSGVFDLSWMIFAVNVVNMDDFIAKIVSNVIVVIINYILSKLFVFKNTSENDGLGTNQSDSVDNGIDDSLDAGLHDGIDDNLDDSVDDSIDDNLDDSVGASLDASLDAHQYAGLGTSLDADQYAGLDTSLDADQYAGLDTSLDTGLEASLDASLSAGLDSPDSAESSGDESRSLADDFFCALWSLMRKHGLLILSFFAPALLICIAFIANGMYPGGTGSILVIDNYHQYTPFLMEFSDMLKNGDSFMHSWNAGLSTNFLSRYAYYLASPLNFFSIFFKRELINDFLQLLVIIRVGISGMAFFIYLRNRFKKANINTIAFSCMYALSAFVLAYYWNVMWFDCISIFPIVMLGLERLVDRNRALVYCITLAVSILSNFYIGLIVCIFSVIYFIFYYLCQNPGFNIKKILGRTYTFAIYSLLAGFATAVVTLPAIYGLTASSNAGASFSRSVSIYKNVLDIVANHLTLVQPSIMVGLPNVYCGVVVFFLLPLYLLNRKIALREKIVYSLLLAFMILSFNLNILDFLWHGMHFPNSLFFRFAFIYIFLLLAMSYNAIVNLDGVRPREILAILAVAVGFIFFMEKQPSENTETIVTYISALYLMVYSLILYGIRHFDKKAAKTAISVIFVIVVATELCINACYRVGEAGIFSRDNYLSRLREVTPAVEWAESMEDGFERMEFTEQASYNTPVVYGYKGISHFSSTSYVKVNDLFGNLGFIHSNAWYVYRSNTPVANSMMSLKYILSKDKDFDTGVYPYLGSMGGVRIHENQYFLPIGFMVNSDIHNWNLSGGNPFEVQEDFLGKALGRGINVFNEIRVEPGRLENMQITNIDGTTVRYVKTDPLKPSSAVLTVSSDNSCQAYVFARSSQSENLEVIKGESKNSHSIRYPQIIDCGYLEAGGSFEVSLEFPADVGGDSFTLIARGFDEEAYIMAYERLNSQAFYDVEYTDTSLKAKINVLEKGTLFTSIPYDDGWAVKVNGQIQEKGSVGGGALMSLELDRGAYEIEFNYFTKGLLPGLIVTLISIMLIAVLATVQKRELQEQPRPQTIL